MIFREVDGYDTSEAHRRSSSEALPRDLEDQIARMQQSQLWPHDWLVLKRKIAAALAEAHGAASQPRLNDHCDPKT